MPRLCIEYPGICLTTEENHGKPVRVTEWRSAVQRLTRFVLSTWPFRAMASIGLLSPSALGFRVMRRGQPLGQLKYLSNCRTRGFPTSANFESKLSVRALMWSANSGTPTSSCICLLLTYQWAPVARRRHLEFNTCNLRTWERVADLHAGQT